MAQFVRTREFDLFGPWVDEVRDPEDVPRLYRDHGIDFGSARLVLKVPRNIARRDATPDMDLYDFLLIAEPDALTVLERVPPPRSRGQAAPSTYTEQSFAYRDIVAIRDSVNLLDAHLSITASDGATARVRYNGSAAQPITGLIDLLRSTLEPARAPRVPEPSLEPLAERDAALMVDFANAAKRLPGLTAWAWHERRAVRPRGGGVATMARRLAHLGSPMTVHGAVVGADAVAFEAFGRRDWLIRGRAPELSSGRLVVPLAAIDGVDIEAHPAYEGVATVTFASGVARTAMHVPEGSPTLDAISAAFARG